MNECSHKTITTHQSMQMHTFMVKNLLIRFLVCCVFTIPVLLFSPTIQTKTEFYGVQNNFFLFFFSTIIFFYGGSPFFQGLKRELLVKRPGMMTLIGLSISLAYLYSTTVLLGLNGEFFFLELVTLIDIMLLGHILEMRSIKKASQSLERLALLLPATAHKKYQDGTSRNVDVAELAVGDHIIVLPGEKVPADGIVIAGTSEINQAAITGESMPIFTSMGTSVLAGTLNGDGSLIIEVKKNQPDAYVSRVVTLVHRVMESKSQTQDFANKAAFILTLIALTAGIITFVAWLLLGSLSQALEHSITVMITACPHALGLAVPLVLTVVTSLCAQHGLLIQNRTAFEQLKNVDTIIFDKTGTLTSGTLEVTDVSTCATWDADTLLMYAAGIEQYAKHPIADAIVHAAQKKNKQLLAATKSKIFPGKGATGTILGQQIFIGNTHLLAAMSFTSEQALLSVARSQAMLDKFVKQGKTSIFVMTKEGVQGVIALADSIRPEAFQACRALKAIGIDLVLLTGDNNIAAGNVAQQLGIEQVIAEILPDQKASKVIELRKKQKTVAMVGDGVNDAPAIAAANVGIAIGTGTDIILETADIVLVRNNLLAIVEAIKLSQLTRKKMIQNLFWATGYNVIMMPMAAGVFSFLGITMIPSLGAFFMSLSTIIVALNARLISLQ